MRIFNPDGTIALPSPARLDYHGRESDTLPAWLTPVEGAGAVYTSLDPTTTLGGTTLTAESGSTANIFGPVIDLSLFQAVRLRCVFHVEDAHANNALIVMGLRDATPTKGVAIGRQGSSGPYTNNQIRVVASSTSKYVNTFVPNLATGKTFDLSVLLDCTTKDVFVMMGDEVTDIWPAVGDLLELGSVNARIGVGSSGSVTVRRFTLDTWA